jgi:UPF0271 protein
MELVSSVNIACGWHAGDPLVMESTVREAGRLGVGIGAHPGYPDLAGFGRRAMSISPDEARTYVLYQVGALKAFADAAGLSLRHVKLHGAFYNQASADPALAAAVAHAVRSLGKDIAVLALSGSLLVRECAERGVPAASEVFADRAYRSDGSLVPRGQPGAVIADPRAVAARALRMAREGTAESIDGECVRLHADSICVHGDGPDAIAHIEAIREAFASNGISIRRFGEK